MTLRRKLGPQRVNAPVCAALLSFNHSQHEYKVLATMLAYLVEAEVRPGTLCSGTESPPGWERGRGEEGWVGGGGRNYIHGLDFIQD